MQIILETPYLMQIILETPYLMKIILETPYLMKIILETLRAHYIRYLGVYPQESVLLTRYIQVFIPKSLYCSPDIYRCLSK
jgi:hypothetical protein